MKKVLSSFAINSNSFQTWSVWFEKFCIRLWKMRAALTTASHSLPLRPTERYHELCSKSEKSSLNESLHPETKKWVFKSFRENTGKKKIFQKSVRFYYFNTVKSWPTLKNTRSIEDPLMASLYMACCCSSLSFNWSRLSIGSYILGASKAASSSSSPGWQSDFQK